MTKKQRIESICKINNIIIDVDDTYIRRNVDLLAPVEFKFQSGTHILCSPSWYTNKNELWKDLLGYLESELPLLPCDCGDCIS